MSENSNYVDPETIRLYAKDCRGSNSIGLYQYILEESKQKFFVIFYSQCYNDKS